jgi:hypothetical protein
MRPKSQAFAAKARVLKKRAAQSHLSIRRESMFLLSYKNAFQSVARISLAD